MKILLSRVSGRWCDSFVAICTTTTSLGAWPRTDETWPSPSLVSAAVCSRRKGNERRFSFAVACFRQAVRVVFVRFTFVEVSLRITFFICFHLFSNCVFSSFRGSYFELILQVPDYRLSLESVWAYILIHAPSENRIAADKGEYMRRSRIYEQSIFLENLRKIRGHLTQLIQENARSVLR